MDVHAGSRSGPCQVPNAEILRWTWSPTAMSRVANRSPARSAHRGAGVDGRRGPPLVTGPVVLADPCGLHRPDYGPGRQLAFDDARRQSSRPQQLPLISPRSAYVAMGGLRRPLYAGSRTNRLSRARSLDPDSPRALRFSAGSLVLWSDPEAGVQDRVEASRAIARCHGRHPHRHDEPWAFNGARARPVRVPRAGQ